MGTADSSNITVQGLHPKSALSKMLMADNIEPGSDPSYQLCKTIYLYHPLGQKMAEAPITEAQTERRTIRVENAPDEVLEEFLKTEEELDTEGHVHNVHSLARVYGISSVALGCEGKPTDEPLEMDKIWQLPIFFNVLDPLNTAGSLVLNQIPTAADFNKPTHISVNGQNYHGSRYRVVMNEKPVYIAYTNSSFGFVGRSVYQRALFPLQSFIRSMVADDSIQSKLSVFIAKVLQPGSILDNMMEKVLGIQRAKLKGAENGQVLGIGTEDSIETLDMQNVDGAGTYSRTNILKNIATAGDMPAVMLENETLTEGFGEGTEDARRIVRYLNAIRRKLNPTYRWFDNVVQYRAWNPDFYKRIQSKYPDYQRIDYKDAFSQWRAAFKAEWPSLIVEAESEKVQTEKVKFEGIISYLQTYLPVVDPLNKMILLQWAADEVAENKHMFAHPLSLNYDELQAFLVEQHDRDIEQQKAALQNPLGGGEGNPKALAGPKVLKLGRPGA